MCSAQHALVGLGMRLFFRAQKIFYKAILIFLLLETCNKSCFIHYRGNSASQSLAFLNKSPPLGLTKSFNMNFIRQSQCQCLHNKKILVCVKKFFLFFIIFIFVAFNFIICGLHQNKFHREIDTVRSLQPDWSIHYFWILQPECFGRKSWRFGNTPL